MFIASFRFGACIGTMNRGPSFGCLKDWRRFPPLPFRRGEGRGEGSLSICGRPEESLRSVPPLVARGRRPGESVFLFCVFRTFNSRFGLIRA